MIMRARIGVDAGSGYATAVEGISADVQDVTIGPKLIRTNDRVIYGDSGYLGIDKRDEVSSDLNLSQIDYRVNRRLGNVYRKFANNYQAWERR